MKKSRGLFEKYTSDTKPYIFQHLKLWSPPYLGSFGRRVSDNYPPLRAVAIAHYPLSVERAVHCTGVQQPVLLVHVEADNRLLILHREEMLAKNQWSTKQALKVLSNKS